MYKIILSITICLFSLTAMGCTVLTPTSSTQPVDTRYQKLHGSLRPLAIAFEDGDEEEINKWIQFIVPQDKNRFLVYIITDGENEAEKIASSTKIEIVDVDNQSILAYISYKMLLPLNNHANIKGIYPEHPAILE